MALGNLIAVLPRWISHGQVWLNTLEVWATEQDLPSDIGTLSRDLLARLSKLTTQSSQLVLWLPLGLLRRAGAGGDHGGSATGHLADALLE